MSQSENVSDAFACPGCKENEADKLVHLDDSIVECATCKLRYNPQTGGYYIFYTKRKEGV
jgi:hypothetical protein